MLAAARTLLAPFPNAEIVEGDVRKNLPEGPFYLIFLGGLCMYLNDVDAVALLRSLKGRLAGGASIVLRETTVPQRELTSRGDYQAVYRSVSLYQDLFREAGFSTSEVLRNYGYTSMEVAVFGCCPVFSHDSKSTGPACKTTFSDCVLHDRADLRQSTPIHSC